MSCTKPNLVENTIPENRIYCGVALSSIKLSENCISVGLLRKKQSILAGSQPTIHYGDCILTLAVNPVTVPTLKMVLRKNHPISCSPMRCSLEWKENYLLLTSDFVDVYV